MARVAAALGLGLVIGAEAFVAPGSASPGSLRAGRVQQLPAQPSFGASAEGEGRSGFLTACSLGSLVAVVAVVTRRAAAPGKELKLEVIPRPEDNLNDPRFPLFAGSTGGYFSKGTKERHAITWTAKDQFQFEMPTGNWAVMNKGENLCYFRKKEQCISLGKQLRQMKIDNYKIYRLKKDGEVVFMHPADGVFPEKVNKGRVQVNGRPFTVNMNPTQNELKFTKYAKKPYEADALTTLFIKARQLAFTDWENMFALPNPNMDQLVPTEELESYQKEEYTTKLMEALKRVQDERNKSL